MRGIDPEKSEWGLEKVGKCVWSKAEMLSLFRVNILTVFVLGLAVALLNGCTVGPNYRTPKENVPPQFSELPPSGVTSASSEVVQWWTTFQDPILDSLIKQAVSSNKDLRIAEARIREARAQRQLIVSDAYPTVDVSGSYTRSRNSSNANLGSNSGLVQNLFLAGFDASWELDVFGRVRRAAESADATIAATEEDLRDVLVTLLSEVARNYLVVRGNQRRIAIARKNIDLQEKTLDLTRGRFEVGLSTQLQVSQAEAQLATTQSQVPALETSVRQAIHRIGVLLGLQPEALLPELTQEALIPPIPPEVPVGLPSDLLRRRPDVRRTERQLAAATANIGVATADLFPRFFLTGIVGLQSVDASDFVSAGSRFWTVGPTIKWPVFDAGRIRANIKIQNARQEQALAAYEKVVLTALQDVEDALVAYSREEATRTSLSQAVEANRRAVDISRALYQKGLADFLNVLVNQLLLDQSEDELAQSEQKVATNLVALFKALGGGWETPPM